MKKVSIIVITTIIVGTLIFLGIRTFGNKKAKIYIINYNNYEELKNKDGEFMVIFSMTKNKSVDTLEYEISKTLKNKKLKIYEINLDKIDKKHYEEFLNDINDINDKEVETINVPTFIIYKDNKMIYTHEGFISSKELNKVLDENNIK